MTRRARSRLGLAAAGAVALLSLIVASSAAAQSYSLPDAFVRVVVQSDGTLAVDEQIAVAFSGRFTFGFRDIPLRTGESIDRVSVSEGGTADTPNGSTEKQPDLPPGTFGVAQTSHGVSIVWHFQALDEIRTFHVRYRLSGLAIAYDDVVDVNLQVWGKQWKVGLSRLTATLAAPGRILRVWGHPVYVRGDVVRAGRVATLRALNVPAHQFVELRTVLPRSAFTSTAAMKVKPGNGLGKIVAEESADAATYQHDHDRIDDAKRHALRTLLELLALCFLPAGLVLVGVWWFNGRERKTSYDREYEQEPPTDTAPALVPRLLAQGGTAGSLEFTATLFDLIRRKVYKAEHVTTERSTWAGLHTEQLADLQISQGARPEKLEPWEEKVTAVVDGVLGDGSERLSAFREKIEGDRTAMTPRFTAFKEAIDGETIRRSWFVSAGAVPLGLALLAFAAAGVVLLWIGISGWRPVYPRWRDVVIVALGVCAVVNAALLLAGLSQGRLWRRRSPDAEVEAERWDAFRHYLTDFPRLQDAAPATLELWERYLVYGIAFGIADRVLQAAHLAMPAEMHNASTIY